MAAKKSSDRDPRKALTVIDSEGRRQRFLRGMITHDLVQRGLPFEDAYAAARAVRDGLSDRNEVTTSELRDAIAAQLETMFAGSVPPQLSAPLGADVTVIYHGQRQPFSRGLLARSLYAAGLSLDRSYRLVTQLEGELREEGVAELDSDEVARRAAELIERLEGKDSAARYRLIRRIRRLPRPLVLYLGGASGTGKSTLSLELAPLLRIYRINATDTIRQVMRMIFAPAVLPTLYSSSFELAPDAAGIPDDTIGSPHDPEFVERLIASYEEQAVRVCVGVRAVVERAIAENMSIVMEGVHLAPGLVPFGDLEGAVYQIPLLLATRDREQHRSRFLGRARLGGRRAERYLENFGSIRVIHDHLLSLAETHEVAFVDTSSGEVPVTQAVHLVTDLMRQRLPNREEQQPASGVPTLLLIIDGAADRPVRALGGRTPLAAAEMPTLDRLAKEGSCGLADPVSPGVVPDTAAGSLALFAQSPLAMNRGPVEALGAELDLTPGDIALRGNLATLDDAGQVVDRRAGRIRDESQELAAALDRLPLPGSLSDEVEIRVRAGTEHRLAIAIRGDGLSSAIQGSDPGDGAAPGPPLTPSPLNPADETAVYTARILALFEERARRILGRHPVNHARIEKGLPPANGVLTRGAGRVHRLIPLEAAGVPLRLTCISGDRTVLGLARWLGSEVIQRPEMTANLDTDLGSKMKAAQEALQHRDLAVIHIKGADIAAHDQRPELKVQFLEKIDRALADLLEEWEGPLRVAVASDHATLSESGQHAADPLPVLIWGDGIEADVVEAFDEVSVAQGSLQRFPLQLLLGRLYDLS